MKFYFGGEAEMQRRVKVKIVDNEAHIGGLTLRDSIRMLESLRDVCLKLNTPRPSEDLR